MALVIDGSFVSLADLDRVARRLDGVELGTAPDFVERLEASRRCLLDALHHGQPIYGLTTGFGDSVTVSISEEQRVQLALNLSRYHRIGVGAPLSQEEARATVFARLVSLSRGCSAVRRDLLTRLAELLALDLMPVIPGQGSVGASGDLTPLAYLAAAIAGEGQLQTRGRAAPAAEALAAAGLLPLELDAREVLALMNGTSVMAALGGLAALRAERLVRWGTALSAVTCEVLRGNPSQFAAELVGAKAHRGSAAVARVLKSDLEGLEGESHQLQDRYSVRCVPQVLGVALDATLDAHGYVENELNGASDNPLFLPDGQVLHGGNFYGGYVCHAMDSLKVQMANLADLLDRQLLLLCTPRESRGLPANLVKEGARHPERHGFKAAQITSSALAVEAAKLSMPASVFSRSTENHNQDKVSLGTIAARDCLRVLEWTETIAAISTLAVVQALELRGERVRSVRGSALLGSLRSRVAQLAEDRAMDADVDVVLGLYRDGRLGCGAFSDFY